MQIRLQKMTHSAGFVLNATRFEWFEICALKPAGCSLKEDKTQLMSALECHFAKINLNRSIKAIDHSFPVNGASVRLFRGFVESKTPL